eukprot:3422036-Pleurochrysis_carterae.AAC.1
MQDSPSGMLRDSWRGRAVGLSCRGADVTDDTNLTDVTDVTIGTSAPAPSECSRCGVSRLRAFASSRPICTRQRGPPATSIASAPASASTSA